MQLKLLIISIILFSIQFTDISFFKSFISDYYTGFLFKGSDFLTVLLNMGIDYTSKIGLFLVLGIIGFLSIIGKSSKGFKELFVIFTIILFIPFMGLEDYSPVFFLPILVLITGLGITTIFYRVENRKLFTFSLIFIFLISTVGFSFFLVDHWNIWKQDMSDETYHLALFVEDRTNGTSVANSGTIGVRTASYSNKPCLPFGGENPPYNSPEQLIFDFVEKDELIFQSVPLSQLDYSSDHFYYVKNAPNAKGHWVSIMESLFSNEKSINLIKYYNIHYIIKILQFLVEQIIKK